jgi:hypothetical protein
MSEFSVCLTHSRYIAVILVIEFKCDCSFSQEYLCYDYSREKN